MCNHLNAFFNTHIIPVNPPNNFYEHVGKLATAGGDWCFTPIRYLYNGQEIKIDDLGRSKEIEEDKCCDYVLARLFKNILSIICLIPILITGTPFKCLGLLLSSSQRQDYHFTATHYIPIDQIEIGSPHQPVTESEVERKLADHLTHNLYRKAVQTLIIHSIPGTEFKTLDGLIPLNPRKLVIVNGRIGNHTEIVESLGEKLDLYKGTFRHPFFSKYNWEYRRASHGISEPHKYTDLNGSGGASLIMYQISNIEEALRDRLLERNTPHPEDSYYVQPGWFNKATVNRIYFIP